LKRFFKSEAGAAVLWILSALILAAAILPWVYQGGKAFGDYAQARDLPGYLESIGRSCRKAEIGRYFSRSLMFSVLVLLPLLLWRVRAIRDGKASPALRNVGWKRALVQLAVGCGIAAGILWGLGMVLEAAGAYTAKPVPPLGKLLNKSVIPALVAAPLEEWLFRGLMLGLWLRFAKPLAACLGTSLFFAFVHFLSPPEGSVIADPAAALAGFELLGKILLHFAEPLFFVTDFATLFGIGMILAWARLRTGALWFSIGLHAGWILAFKAFNLLYRQVDGHPLQPWGIGESLKSGILPLLALGFTAWICHFAMRGFEARRAQPRITVTTTTD
jgi:uncharacterized protein